LLSQRCEDRQTISTNKGAKTIMISASRLFMVIQLCLEIDFKTIF
jgi:hypothetical protein